MVPSRVVQAEPSYVFMCPLLCFAIVGWHQMDPVVRQFGGLQHIPMMPLNIEELHRHDSRLGRVEWYPDYLRNWYEMWEAQLNNCIFIHHAFDLCPS
ncbi:hypothetical protein AHAS_Ahas15G0102100 [Arachis hypogaea]